ncbi:MAG: hypothetical protein JW957_00545 [Candidatus Omnitrophica bacterium]|nr:hypothetical protein [Candidatus Omnitrophota bacterium]
MSITQLSVFLENRLGRLNDVLAVLGQGGINIRALSLADKANYGILRLIVDNAQSAIEKLKKADISVNSASVVAAEIEDEPGGLLKAVKILVDNGVNVEYMYAFVEKSGDKAVVVFRVEDNEKAEEVLKASGIKLFTDNKGSF